jgi:hypothetical protein
MRDLLILTAAAFALIGNVPATAQTPDGKTPAEETVCNVLIGATPGLYGLCVAYCEAHDADILSPSGDPAELNVPNRNILQNYNEKKTEFDPPMPCVQPGGCSCWTADQLSMLLPPSMNIDVKYSPNACRNTETFVALVNFENGKNVKPWIQLRAGNTTYEEYCNVDKSGYPLGPPAIFLPITGEEFQTCKSLLAARANAAKTPGVVWDCF